MKIIIVPHTHWDREWYFTSETSQELLNFNLDNCLNNNYPINKFYLDGQVSIVEDYLKHANTINKAKFIKLINDKKLIVGPLYSQPDAFNSLGETTMRNIAMGQKLLHDWNMPCSQVFYCPDTFGFNSNFPQILSHYGFNQFVFWRGLAHNSNDQDYFKWQGIDGTTIDCYRLKFGYWTLGSMFNWYGLNANNIEQEAQKFLTNFEKSPLYAHFKKWAPKYKNKIILPFGGDQAPIHCLTNRFFALVNQYSEDEWVIDEFDAFFKDNKPAKLVTDILDYGYDSKIHRTISSTRYDFKKLFRECEIKLYHQLEPLQLYYHHCDHTYIANNDDIIKQLCLMQAHDVLGGCVTDNVYLASYQKLLDINERLQTKIEMLMKQLALQMKLTSDHLLIFNPHVSDVANNIVKCTVYTKQQLHGLYSDKQCTVIVQDSQLYENVDDTYVSNLLIINNQLTPMNLYVIDINQLQDLLHSELDPSSYVNQFNQFEVFYDKGDLFDADQDTKKIPLVKNTIIAQDLHTYQDGLVKHLHIQGNLNIDKEFITYKIDVIMCREDNYIDIQINNTINDIIVNWIPFNKFKLPKFLQHLAINEYSGRVLDDWKEQHYKENPLNVEKNSGVIFDDHQYVCTRGTNQFIYEDNKIKINLFRSTGYLGKSNLENRPGVASGLTDHRLATPLGQLKKNMVFNFKIGQHHQNIANKLNSFYATPIVFKVQSKHLIASKMERFVFLTQPFEIKPLKFISLNDFVSSLCLNAKNQMLATLVNIDKPFEPNYNKIRQEIIAHAK